MIIAVELLIIIAVVVLYIVWWVINKITTKIALKRYKPENDYGRIGEEIKYCFDEFPDCVVGLT